MLVMKFGGTSIADVAAIKRVVALIRQNLQHEDRVLVVVSAIAEITNRLTELTKLAEQQLKQEVEGHLTAIKAIHLELANKLLTHGSNQWVLAQQNLTDYCWGLKQDLQEIFEKGLTTRIFAKILAYGELLSSTLLQAILAGNELENLWVDARTLIITDHHYAKGNLDFAYSEPRIVQTLGEYFTQYRLIITQGFIAGTKDGVTSILGREGSDFSAAIFGSALKAREIQIWTDVDGVMTGDPKVIPQAQLITQLSIEEMAELSSLGAKVLHPMTVDPLRKFRIPLKIFNSQKGVEQLGTLVDSHESSSSFYSITNKRQIVTVRLHFKPEVNEAEGLQQLGQLLNQYRINPLFISMVGSHSLMLIKVEQWEKIAGNLSTIGRIKSNLISGLISIMSGGQDGSWIKILNLISPRLKEWGMEELFFSATKKSVLVTLPEAKLLSVAQALHQLLWQKLKP